MMVPRALCTEDTESTTRSPTPNARQSALSVGAPVRTNARVDATKLEPRSTASF